MAKINKFWPIKKRTTFNGRNIKFYNGTGDTKTAMPLDDVDIIMDFREVGGKATIFSFKTSDGTITKTDVGTARMMPRLMNYPVATYQTTMLMQFANGTVKPYAEILWEIN
jgi:hypothetical protein